jgi:hypothetical protein
MLVEVLTTNQDEQDFAAVAELFFSIAMMVGVAKKGIKLIKAVYPKNESEGIVHAQVDALMKVT